jgi:histone H2A
MEVKVEPTGNFVDDHGKHEKKAVHWVESDLEEIRYYDAKIDKSQQEFHNEGGSKRNRSEISTSHRQSHSYTHRRGVAGLIFSVGRISSWLRRGKYVERVGQGAAVYLTAVLQYVCTEIVDSTVLLCEDEERDKIDPKRVVSVIEGDSELRSLFQNNLYLSLKTICGSNKEMTSKPPDNVESVSHSTTPSDTDGNPSVITTDASPSNIEIVEDLKGNPNFEDDLLAKAFEEADLMDVVEEPESELQTREFENPMHSTTVPAEVSAPPASPESESKPPLADDIYHIFKQVCHSSKVVSTQARQYRLTMTISKKAVRLINELLMLLFAQLALEGSREVRRRNMTTLSCRCVQIAVHEVLCGDMCTYAELAGNEAVKTFCAMRNNL